MLITFENTEDNLRRLVLYAGVRVQPGDVVDWCATDIRDIQTWAASRTLDQLGVPGIVVPEMPNVLRRHLQLTGIPKPWLLPPGEIHPDHATSPLDHHPDDPRPAEPDTVPA